MDPQEIFRECKNLIAKSDFENLAEKLKSLDDDDHIKYLCLELNDKFEEKCNVINNKTNSLNRLDENALVGLKDSIEEIKRIHIVLNSFIDESIVSIQARIPPFIIKTSFIKPSVVIKFASASALFPERHIKTVFFVRSNSEIRAVKSAIGMCLHEIFAISNS
jgi:hypothetical protein